MKKVSKYLSVLAISTTILTPTMANAAYGPWEYHSSNTVSRGFNAWVLECNYFRDTLPEDGPILGNREWKRIDLRIWNMAKPHQCPAASSI